MTTQNHAREYLSPAASPYQEPAVATSPEPATSTTPLTVPMVVPGQVIDSSVEPAARVNSRVEVGRDGVIQIHDDVLDEERTPVAEVTMDTFYAPSGSETTAQEHGTRRSLVTDMTLEVDLNAIADAVKRAQRSGGRPADPNDRIYVGREGEVIRGSEATGGERIAEVTGDTFYSRLASETEFAQSHMPRNTMRVSDGTYDGWHFSITNEFGDRYSLFLYYHPSYHVYRVALIEPRMGGHVDAHGTHLWPDGTLCLTHATGSGYSSMAATYAKAALWTRGASCYRRGYGFQFNVGQD